VGKNPQIKGCWWILQKWKESGGILKKSEREAKGLPLSIN
jgi:hypothetical protein